MKCPLAQRVSSFTCSLIVSAGGLVKEILQTKRDYEAEHMPLKTGDKVLMGFYPSFVSQYWVHGH